MTEDHTIAKALAEISQRRDLLQAEYERIGSELAKLQMAEGALRSIVENTPLDASTSLLGGLARGTGERSASAPPSSGRGPRGPRANSAKGRLKALLEGAGPQGLSTSQITQRLPDVAPATLNAYLSTMASSGEAIRKGDFISLARASAADADAPSEDETASDHEGAEAEPGETVDAG